MVVNTVDLIQERSYFCSNNLQMAAEERFEAENFLLWLRIR